MKVHSGLDKISSAGKVLVTPARPDRLPFVRKGAAVLDAIRLGLARYISAPGMGVF